MKKQLLLIFFLFLSLNIYSQENTKISTIDFVQTLNNNEKEVIYYYENNWEILRKMAIKKNYIDSYQLLKTKSTKDAPFSFMLITTYKNKTQFDAREKHFEELIRKKMPQRDLIDLLKRVQTWIPYTRHFGPPSGASSKLKNEVYKYIFTILGYGCNLGANQTVRHTQDALTSRMLRRINKQHIDSRKIDAAIRDIINNYNHWELTNYWGDGSDMIVDGTHIELIENNMLYMAFHIDAILVEIPT